MKDVPIFKKTVRHEIPPMKKESLAAFFKQLGHLKGEHEQLNTQEYQFTGKPEVKSSFYGKFDVHYSKNLDNLNSTLTITHRGMVKAFYIVVMAGGFIAQVLFLFFNDFFSDFPIMPIAFVTFEVVALSLMFFLNARRAVQTNIEFIEQMLRSVAATGTNVN